MKFTAKVLTPSRSNIVDINAFLGIGSDAMLATDYDAIDGEIYNVLTTLVGSCEFEPEYGAAFLTRIFDPNDPFTWDQIKFDVYNAVNRWVKGVKVNFDETLVSPTERGFAIQVAYYISIAGIEGSVVIEYGDLK